MFSFLSTVQLLLVCGGIWWFVRRNDAIPLLSSLFLFYVVSFRFWSVRRVDAGFVDITPFGFGVITPERAESAIGLLVLGESLLLLTYFGFQTKRIQGR